MTQFIDYVNYVRRQKDAGEDVEIDEEFLARWKERLRFYEKQRITEEEKAKVDVDAKYNSLILKQLLNATYSDKLYQIAMTKPEVWKDLKRKEYASRIGEEKDNAQDEIHNKYKMLNRGLEDEEYLNNIINKGQSQLLPSVQANVQGVFNLLL